MIINQVYWIYSANQSMNGYFGGFWGSSIGKMKNMTNIYSMFNLNNGIPSGYTPHYALNPPIKANGIASMIKGTSTITQAELANAINLLNTASPSAGIGEVNTAILQMIVSLQATITGEGTINTAQLAGVSSLVATVTGSGGINTAIMGAIANMSATVSSVSSVIAELYGLLHLSGHIYVNEGAQTAEQLAAAVWAANATANNEIGTMGEKMNDAGAAGNPWAAETVDNNEDGTFGKLVQDTKKDIGDAQALILSI